MPSSRNCENCLKAGLGDCRRALRAFVSSAARKGVVRCCAKPSRTDKANCETSLPQFGVRCLGPRPRSGSPAAVRRPRSRSATAPTQRSVFSPRPKRCPARPRKANEQPASPEREAERFLTSQQAPHRVSRPADRSTRVEHSLPRGRRNSAGFRPSSSEVCACDPRIGQHCRAFLPF
jgi:hypothetical protein